ncbi:L-aminoadipate-semialdehyde dehydrogenase-phosphopantetheinyl transferase isoform X2 [Folsomia candida]|uniref:L-aminoadipate-semialdehyde dehydrogenase-phosphopantetheinyl transferase isoform X2 n=1 Tax=Folsomia candida TaxID=158441 RepID=UPI000B8F98AA|nr:L-aminoadipate-semialdehyde dehydrogenase-phosphopantetheinyl transferase isoform X2 [Folsomia candida]XP_021952381.1 L-aminoadipate-semialdehyde dehydrogenase-phosphopantetheinyl transferase isoform X2 [Folsomia candida]
MVLQHIPMGTNIFTTIPDFKIDSGRGEGPDWTLLIYELGRDDHNKPILISPTNLADKLDDDDNDDCDVTNNDDNVIFDECSNVNIRNLNFNVSHQGSYVVLASDPSATHVGIDVMNVEKPGRISDTVDEYFRLMNRQFTENEWRQIKGLDLPGSLSDKKKMMNFTRFWCLKESYVKAIGVGIVIDLRTVDFNTKTDLSFESDGPKLATDTVVKVNGCLETEWSFEERCLDDETHLVAVAKKIPSKNKDIDSDKNEYIPPEFIPVSLDFLLDNMTPLQPEESVDTEWVEAFLKKNNKK